MPDYPGITRKILTRTTTLLLALFLGVYAAVINPAESYAADPGPDLTVPEIALSPGEPAIDDSVTITVAVKNQGTEEAGLSLVACYVDGTLLASEYINPLAAGLTTSITFTWTAQPGTHTIKAVADSNGLIGEADETNNTKTFTLSTQAPDLIIQSITWAPDEPSRGDAIVFSVTIKNQGSSQSRPTNVNFYIDGNSRGYQDVSSINAGGTLTKTYNWVAQSGQHVLKAVIDENNLVKESDDTNNENTLTFSTLPPDLVIQGITWSPENPSKNDTVTFTATVKNQGTGRADASHLAYYIDGAYQSSIPVSQIEAGVSINITFNWTALAEMHEIKAVIDSYGKIPESDESNNENTVSFLTLAPDLTVTSITWTPENAAVGDSVTFTATIKNMGGGKSETSRAATYISGQYTGRLDVPEIESGSEAQITFQWVAESGSHAIAVHIDQENRLIESNEENNKLSVTMPVIPPDVIIPSISWEPENPAIGDTVTFTVTVENQGGGAAENFRIAYYIDDTLLTSDYVAKIASGSSVNITTTWKSVNGLHTFKAIADYNKQIAENNEDNNENSVTVIPHMPDLIIANVTWSPADMPVGNEVIFNIVVKNQGSRESGQSRIAYYIDGSVVGYKDIQELAAGATLTERLPWMVSAGSHTVDIIADSSAQVVEIDEENNIMVVNLPPPDLVVEDIAWTPVDAAVGDEVTFSARIINQGSGNAQPSRVDYYVDGAQAGTWNLPQMASGDTVTQTFTWTAESGTHSIRIAADTGNRVTETDETNNEKETSFITLTPDLVIENIAWSIDDPMNKDIVTFIVTIKNQGGNTAGESQLTYSINDTATVLENVEPIAAGEAAEVKFYATMGAGTHTVAVTADTAAEIAEIDETNNEASLSFSTIVPDLAVKSINWSPTNPAIGDTVTITVEIENLGRVKAVNPRLELLINGTSIGVADIEELAVGTAVTRDFTWTAEAGLHEMETMVDMDELIVESNEANNMKSRTLSLEAPAQPVDKPARITTGAATDNGFLGDWWWTILIATALLGVMAFLSALKSMRKG